MIIILIASWAAGLAVAQEYKSIKTGILTALALSIFFYVSLDSYL